jgi:hypothetical protein
VAEPVILRNLRALREISSIIVRYPVLSDGTDLAAVYGPLACPLGDGDIPKPRSNQDFRVPTPAELPRIYEALLDWAGEQRRRPIQAYRSVVMLISSFESAMRGAEQRSLNLGEQVFDRRAAVPAFANPIHLLDTKTGVRRNVYHEPFGLDVVNYWLRELRPRIAQPLDGFVYPAAHGETSALEPLTSSSFSEAMKRPLQMLKERGLVDRAFTFHWARKTFATNFLREGGTLPALMGRGGWASPSSLAAYVRPDDDAIEAADAGFRRTMGRRPR